MTLFRKLEPNPKTMAVMVGLVGVYHLMASAL